MQEAAIVMRGAAATTAARAGWWGVAAIVCALVVPNFFHAPLGALLITGLLALGLTAALRPFAGLLIFAGLAPLSTAIFILSGTPVPGFQFAEAFALVLIGGWAARHAVRPRPLACAGALRWAVFVLAAMAVAWAVVDVGVWVSQNPQTPPLAFLATTFSDYLPSTAPAPARSALVVVESLLLLLLAADACGSDEGRRDTVLWMMVAGAAAAATLNVVRYLEVVLAQADRWRALGYYFAHIRVSVQFPDKNAAGSYFAMIVIVAGGLVSHRRSTAVGLIAAALGVWLSGSRFALGAVILGTIVAASLAFKGRGRRALVPVVTGLALIGGLTAAGWATYPSGRNFLASKALNIRLGLARGGVQMAMDHPLVGVGPGHFYQLSNQYAADAIVPFGLPYENAHNNFIQVLAELGFPGLVVFLLVLALAIREGLRSASPLAPASIGLLGGLVAYLVTCIGGHPLLIPEAAYPFWIALGLAAAPLAGTPAPPPRWYKYVALVAIVALAVSLPWRVRAAIDLANMEGVSVGLSSWQVDPPTGQRYRTAGAVATFYVPSEANVVRLPLRNALGDGRTLEVEVLLEGRQADRVTVPADGQWYEKRLVLPRSGTVRAYSQIELRTMPAGGAETGARVHDIVMVGRPVLEWGR